MNCFGQSYQITGQLVNRQIERKVLTDEEYKYCKQSAILILLPKLYNNVQSVLIHHYFEVHFSS